MYSASCRKVNCTVKSRFLLVEGEYVHHHDSCFNGFVYLRVIFRVTASTSRRFRSCLDVVKVQLLYAGFLNFGHECLMSWEKRESVGLEIDQRDEDVIEARCGEKEEPAGKEELEPN